MLGCGGIVPDIDGPSHRYMLAAPGCWAAYTDLLAAPSPDGAVSVAGSHEALIVDAYAVQHPGSPNPQAIQSVWVHLIALHLVLDVGWPTSQLVRIRRAGAAGSAGWAWLEPPSAMGPVTAVDVATAEPGARAETIRRWVEGAWAAWDGQHDRVRTEAVRIVGRLG